MRFRQVIGAVAVAVAAGSCSLGGPEDSATINLFLDIDKATLQIDELMNITVTARNVGFEPVSLTGPSNCLLYIEVLNSQGSVVWHSNAGCAGSPVTEQLIVGTDKVQVFIWNGSNLAGARVASGFYHIRAVARLTESIYYGPPFSVSVE